MSSRTAYSARKRAFHRLLCVMVLLTVSLACAIALQGCYTVLRHKGADLPKHSGEGMQCTGCHSSSVYDHHWSPYYSYPYSLRWRDYYYRPWWYEGHWGAEMPPSWGGGTDPGAGSDVDQTDFVKERARPDLRPPPVAPGTGSSGSGSGASSGKEGEKDKDEKEEEKEEEREIRRERERPQRDSP